MQKNTSFTQWFKKAKVSGGGAGFDMEFRDAQTPPPLSRLQELLMAWWTTLKESGPRPIMIIGACPAHRRFRAAN